MANQAPPLLVWKDLFQKICVAFANDPAKKSKFYSFLQAIIRVRRNWNGEELFPRYVDRALDDPKVILFLKKDSECIDMPITDIQSMLNTLKELIQPRVPAKPASNLTYQPIPTVENAQLQILFEKFAQLDFEHQGKRYQIAGHLMEVN